MSAPGPAIYLDNAATTRVDPRVVEVVVRYLAQDYGNPSSLHRLGVAATGALGAARAAVAAAIEAAEAEVVFTSGGTEANALALLGVAGLARGRHLVASAVEHPAVLATLERCREAGFELSLAPVDAEGRVDPETFVGLVRPDTAICALMLVQNEIGTIQPVAEVAALLKRAGRKCRFHVDAVQALGHLPISVRELGCDTLALSAHKVHGPKGAGALYVRRGVRLRPLTGGGGQERGLRPGTENVPAIAGFGLAARLAEAARPTAAPAMVALRDRLVAAVLDGARGARLVGPRPGPGRVGNSAALAFAGVRAEVLLHALEARDVFVSSGAACAAHKRSRSHVLTAIGLPDELETVRLTLSRETTADEITRATAALLAAIREV